ncbi:hypothetical protein [Acidocella aromatica]|uniref:Uncharacterized protein n=1 Tax=Acidocella aromatica TaxID=1303579 RepID=A0A840VF56_9PROT|nr:hypothetical protein [Acidocella aromatica]MBB5374326.1 hypothetical protein [Acidocella aromatica]
MNEFARHGGEKVKTACGLSVFIVPRPTDRLTGDGQQAAHHTFVFKVDDLPAFAARWWKFRLVHDRVTLGSFKLSIEAAFLRLALWVRFADCLPRVEFQ